MGMGAPIGSQGGMPPQQKPGVPMPAQGKGQPMPAQGKGQPGVQQPNRPGPMPAQGKGQPMQPQGPYGQRPEDMYKGKDFNKGQGPYGQPNPGQLPQPGQLPDYALPYAPALRPQGLPARSPLQQMDPAMMSKVQQMAALTPQVQQPYPGLVNPMQIQPSQLQGLGQVPANQGLGSLGNLGLVGTKLGGLM